MGDEEDEGRTGPTEEMLDFAREVYKEINELQPDKETMDKEDLIIANGGDYGTFEMMDEDRDGTVAEDEWIAWCTKEHSEKRRVKKGMGDKA